MKTRSQKLISLVLVLVMLVTMIPAGIFTASAATTYSIANATEWNAFADGVADGSITVASGDTVKLTGTIDFEKGEAKPLVPASKGAVTLNFNGQGNTIKNATATAPLIAGALRSSKAGSITVQGVTFENITLAADGDVGLIAGTFGMNTNVANDQNLTLILKNIVVKKCNVTSNTGNAAALIGTHYFGTNHANAASKITATNVTVDAATTITAKTHAAGLVARGVGTSRGAYEFSNVSMAATVTSTYDFVLGTAAQTTAVVGGLLGAASSTSTTRNINLTFTNCAVTGSLKSNAKEETHGAVGGLFGYLAVKVASTIKLTNVAINLKEFNDKSTYLGSFGTVNNTNANGTVLVMDTAYVNNAPTYEFYDVTGIMHLGSTEGELVSGNQKNFDTKQLFKVEFDGNGYLAAIVEVDPANCEHEWSGWNVSIPATGFAAGLQERVCSTCTYKETEEIPELDFTVEEILAAYETMLTFEIKSDVEWNAIATSGKTFAGKTIILGADIDFKNDVALPLVPASLGATTVKFDGNNKTIKNATATAPLIAGALKTASAGSTMTVKGVTFENITLAADGDVGLIAGTFGVNDNVAANQSMSLTLQNIVVKNCKITSNEGNAAALIGTHYFGTNGANAVSKITATNVTVDAATTITAKTHAAGLVASGQGTTRSAYDFSNVYMAATVTSTYDFALGTDAQTTAVVGGLLGAASIARGTRNINLTFTNCVVAGSLLQPNAKQETHGAVGGLFGYLAVTPAASTITLTNVAINLKDFTDKSTYLGSFGTVNNTNGTILVMDTAYVNNAPTYEFYDVTDKMYLDSAEGEQVTGTQKNFDTKQLFKVEFDEDGYLAAIVEVDPTSCTHDWEWVVVTPATGFAAGLKERVCSKCTYKETEEIPDLDFTVEEILAAYDTMSTFEIKSVAEWNAIATSGKTFAGKTIILGDNIDFTNDAALPLVPASLGATTVKFDGKGYTIKNATATAPLIAGILTASNNGGDPASGDKQFSDATTIKNVTFQNITMTVAKGNAALVAGELTGSYKDYIFENIKVVGCTITAEAGNAAAIVGYHDAGTGGNYNISNVKMTNITVDANTQITASVHAAGVLAQAYGAYAVYMFQNVYVAATVTTTFAFEPGVIQKYSAVAAGILGHVVGYTDSDRVIDMKFENCVVVGSLLAPNATEKDHGIVGGLFGYFAGGNHKTKLPTLTIRNIVIDLVDFTQTMNHLACFGTYNNNIGAVLSYYNVYVGKAPKAHIYDIYGNNKNSETGLLNGAIYLFEAVQNNRVGGWAKVLPNIATMNAARQASTIKIDENGFITKILDNVRGAAYQTSLITTKEDGTKTHAIRFVGISQLADLDDGDKKVNMKIVATVNGKSAIFDTSSEDCKDAHGNTAPGAKLYDGLTAYEQYGVGGEKGTIVYAKDCDAEKLIGFTLYNVPADQAITFEVTISYTNAYGVLVETQNAFVLDFDANGNGPASAQK